MAGIVSVRFTKDERASIKQRARDGGFRSMSAFIRVRLGFDPSGGIDPVLEYEEIDSVGVVRNLAEVRDRIDTIGAILRQLCRAAGVRPDPLDAPRRYPHVPAVDPPDADGHMDIPTPGQRATRAMPAGFER